MSSALLGWSAIHFAWQGTGLAIIAAILLRQSGLGARMRYAVGCAVMLVMAITPVLTAVWLRSNAATGVLSEDSAIATATPLTSVAVDATVWMEWLAAAAPWIGVVWLVGVLLSASHLLLAWRHAQRIRSNARPLTATTIAVTVPLLESADVDVPVAIGCVQPVVVFPPRALRRLSAAELELIIAHELTHIRRRDPIVNFVQVMLECLLFFHPGVWWLSRQIRADREHCCDESVVRTLGQPLVYARALTRLEELRRHRLALAASGGALLARVRHITTVASPTPRFGRVAFAIVLLAFLAAFNTAAVRTSAPALGYSSRVADPLMYVEAYDDAGPFTVSIRGGRVVEATVNGRAVPPHHLLQRGDSLRIISDDGTSSFTVRVRPDGIVWDARSTSSS
jgi:beta-lactamase regulating signal transducer with metallopeptidase domain